MLTYTKGSKVLVSRLVVDPLTCLAGVQPKVGAHTERFLGTVRHVRGDGATLDQCSRLGVWVEPQDTASNLHTTWCDRCQCQEVEAIDPKDIYRPDSEECP